MGHRKPARSNGDIFMQYDVLLRFVLLLDSFLSTTLSSLTVFFTSSKNRLSLLHFKVAFAVTMCMFIFVSVKINFLKFLLIMPF
jgi:hypothetical protein